MSKSTTVPEGLEKQVIQTLQEHVGRNNAIERDELVQYLKWVFIGIPERVVRQAIHNLRRKGWLICSAPGNDGGYYMAANRDEYLEFREREIHSRAMDLLETEKAMNAGAVQRFGDAVQPGLL